MIGLSTWLCRATVAGVLAGALLGAPSLAPPARAAADPVGLSADGRSWSNDLPTPLFNPALRWVPGESRTSALWVRNRGATDAALAVTMRVGDAGGLLTPGAVSLAFRAQGGSWHDARPGERVSLGRLASGAVRRVEVRASLAWAAGNDTMRRRLDFDVVVRLDGAPAAGAAAAQPDTGDDGGGRLPDTGNPVQWWLVAAGALSVGIGTELTRRFRGVRA
ncbi:hypothetical protein AB3X52_13805 [Nocardioides sp. DS6]|uniref:LPXTG cell wall anchor domain-containing protein n=1 Tax=Nocardioides eburneus TaxID=3231482 RepID=A0ABV3T489_9ACTN